MCEANAYIKEKEEESYELLLESVDKVIPQGEELILEDIFGKKITVKANIKELVLLDHQILLER